MTDQWWDKHGWDRNDLNDVDGTIQGVHNGTQVPVLEQMTFVCMPAIQLPNRHGACNRGTMKCDKVLINTHQNIGHSCSTCSRVLVPNCHFRKEFLHGSDGLRFAEFLGPLFLRKTRCFFLAVAFAARRPSRNNFPAWGYAHRNCRTCDNNIRKRDTTLKSESQIHVGCQRCDCWVLSPF